MNVFICDVTNEELCDKILPSSVDVVTLVSEMPVAQSNCCYEVLKCSRSFYCNFLFYLLTSACGFSTWIFMQIFMLSAVSPKKMPFVLQNLKKILKVVQISSCFIVSISLFTLLASIILMQG